MLEIGKILSKCYVVKETVKETCFKNIDMFILVSCCRYFLSNIEFWKICTMCMLWPFWNDKNYIIVFLFWVHGSSKIAFQHEHCYRWLTFVIAFLIVSILLVIVWPHATGWPILAKCSGKMIGRNIHVILRYEKEHLLIIKPKVNDCNHHLTWRKVGCTY